MLKTTLMPEASVTGADGRPLRSPIPGRSGSRPKPSNAGESGRHQAGDGCKQAEARPVQLAGSRNHRREGIDERAETYQVRVRPDGTQQKTLLGDQKAQSSGGRQGRIRNT